jgi:hypothetical protein
LKMSDKDNNLLNEGVWSKTKHILSKLGRLEKGGKVFGRGEISKKAKAQLANVLNKESNALIKAVDDQIMQSYPGFPNVESHDDFLKGVDAYLNVYLSVVSATKKTPGSQGHLDVNQANSIIKALRIVVKHRLDYDLATVYNTLTEDVNTPISGDNTESETIKTLKSNKLPLALSALGLSIGAFGWLLKSPLIQNLIIEALSTKESVQTALESSEIVAQIGNGQGITQAIEAAWPGVDLSPSAPVSNFTDFLTNTIGNGSLQEGLDNIAHTLKDPNKIVEMKQLIESGNFNTMQELFNQATDDPTSGKGGSWFETIPGGNIRQTFITMVPKLIIRKGIGVAVAGVAANIGSVLMPLGISLLAAGVALKLLRMKGLRSSRAQIFNEMLQKLKLVSVPQGEINLFPPAQIGGTAEASPKELRQGVRIDHDITGRKKPDGDSDFATDIDYEDVDSNSNSNGNPKELRQGVRIDHDITGRKKPDGDSDFATDVDYEEIQDETSGTKSQPKEVIQKRLEANKLSLQNLMKTDGYDEQAVKNLQSKVNYYQEKANIKKDEEENNERLEPANPELDENIRRFEETIEPEKRNNKGLVNKDIRTLRLAKKSIPSAIIDVINKDIAEARSKDKDKAIAALRRIGNYNPNLKGKFLGMLKSEPYFLGDSSRTLKNDLTISAQGKKSAVEGQGKFDFVTKLNMSKRNIVKKDDTLKQVTTKFIKQVSNGKKLSATDTKELRGRLFNKGEGLVDVILSELDVWMGTRIKNFNDYKTNATLNEETLNQLKTLIENVVSKIDLEEGDVYDYDALKNSPQWKQFLNRFVSIRNKYRKEEDPAVQNMVGKYAKPDAHPTQKWVHKTHNDLPTIKLVDGPAIKHFKYKGQPERATIKSTGGHKDLQVNFTGIKGLEIGDIIIQHRWCAWHFKPKNRDGEVWVYKFMGSEGSNGNQYDDILIANNILSGITLSFKKEEIPAVIRRQMVMHVTDHDREKGYQSKFVSKADHEDFLAKKAKNPGRYGSGNWSDTYSIYKHDKANGNLREDDKKKA